MSPSEQPARYRLLFDAEIDGDLAALRVEGRQVAEAAVEALSGLAHGRVVGKRLGVRPGVGDLSGLARVKFDVPGRQRQRFRLVYRDVDDDTREVVTMGRREQYTVYRLAVERLAR